MADAMVKMTVRPEEELKQEGWTYKGCGYWIDPVTKTKVMTSTALSILRKRTKEQK